MLNHRELAEAITAALGSEANLPVPLQALIAGTLICARGGAPSRLGMAKVGGYSYGSSQSHYAFLLEAIIARLPAEVAGMAGSRADPATAARLSEELRRRDETIAALRRELRAAAGHQKQVRRYALALHERLRALEAGDGVPERGGVR